MKVLYNLMPHLAVFNLDDTTYFTSEEVDQISHNITVASILFIISTILLVSFVLMFVFTNRMKKSNPNKKYDNDLNSKNGGTKA